MNVPIERQASQRQAPPEHRGPQGDAMPSQSFSRRAWIATAAVLLALIIPSLFLTLGHDQALFHVSGEKILDGAVHYRDIVDIKPPLIYHLYAFAIAIFDHGTIGIRLFDALVQLATCWLMIATIRRAGGRDIVAAIAPVCYLLLYFSQKYGDAAQSEAYVGLLGLAIARLFLFDRSALRYLVIGVLSGVLFLLKLPFGMMLVIIMLADLLLVDDAWRRRGLRFAAMGGGFALMLGVLALYLAAGDALHGFENVSSFTSAYAKIELRNPAQWLRNLLTLPALHFADNYSMLFTLATVAGAALSLRPRGARSGDRHADNHGTDYGRLLRFCVIAFLLLFVTIVVEGKYPSYHFIRLYPFGGILAAEGLVAAAALLRRRSTRSPYRWLVGTTALAGIMLFGPLPRYAWQTLRQAKRNLDVRSVEYNYESLRNYYDDAELRAIGYHVRQPGSEDDFFAMSSQAGLLYFYARRIPPTPVYHSAFIIAPFAPREWRDSTRAYLLLTRPRYIALDRGDSLPGITGSNLTSDRAMRALPGIDSLLRNEYAVVVSTPSFDLYERKEGR